MNDRMTRREFLGASASLAAGAGIALTIGRAWAGPPGAAASKPAKDADKLPLRALGQTGLNVSILGLGGDGIISDSTDKDVVIKFISAALDAGVNFVDAGYVYGQDGRCEKNLGLVMGTARRKDVVLATKTGARKYDTAMQQIETSLKRMGVSSLDLVQVHHLTDADDLKQMGSKDGVLAAMRKLRDQKVVRFIGLTGHPDSANVKKAVEMYDWDTLMCFVNPAKFSRPAMEEQLPAARKKNMGIIAMKVFGGRPGMLSGKEPGQADAPTLLRYALGQDVSVVLAGMSSMKQLEDNLKTAREYSPLTAAEIAALTRQINAKADAWKR
jgi:aryl-alcohol dehydrogenase-like predicted oxidoreductase